MSLQDYILNHTTRGECQCGKCLVSQGTEEKPEGHIVDVVFFTVGMKGEPDKKLLLELVQKELPYFWPFFHHDYIRLGSQLGSQDLALRMMALGHLLGAWRLSSPEMVKPGISAHERLSIAERGGVLIFANKLKPPAKTKEPVST